MSFSKTCVWRKTIIKKIFFIKGNHYLKGKKVNWLITFLSSKMIFFFVQHLICAIAFAIVCNLKFIIYDDSQIWIAFGVQSLCFACNLIRDIEREKRQREREERERARKLHPIISCTLLRNRHHVYRFLLFLFLSSQRDPKRRPRSLSSVRPKTQQLRETQFNCHVKTMWNGIDVIWLGAPRVSLPPKVRLLYRVSLNEISNIFVCSTNLRDIFLPD